MVLGCWQSVNRLPTLLYCQIKIVQHSYINAVFRSIPTSITYDPEPHPWAPIEVPAPEVEAYKQTKPTITIESAPKHLAEQNAMHPTQNRSAALPCIGKYFGNWEVAD